MKIFFLALFISVSSIMYSQNPVLRTWMGVGFEQKLKISKFKFKIGIQQQVRIKNLVYNPRVGTFTQAKVSKKMTDWYKLALAYRINYIGGVRHRLAVSNYFKYGKKKSNLSLRLKYQMDLEENTPFSNDFRAKLAFKYKANKDFRPYVFGEILYNLTYNYSNFNEYRFGMGFDADIKKKHNFTIALVYIEGINLEKVDRNLVLQLYYLFAN